MTKKSLKPQGERTVMGFDFGTKSIGIAIGQELTGSASSLKAVKAQDGIPNWDELHKIIKQYQPNVFLVGLPLNMDDSESELSARARKFARRLRHQTNIETWMVDERLSTRAARDELSHYHAQGRGKKLSADSLAATLFIESWYRDPEGLTP